MKKIKLESKSSAIKRDYGYNKIKPEGLKIKKSKNSGKSESTRPKSKLRSLAIFISVLLIIFVGVFGYWRWNRHIGNTLTGGGGARADACTNILNPSCWTEAFKPKLDQIDGKTNVLVIGLDTRDSGSGSGLLNSDTIMLATVDHATNQTRLISFPRDLYAPYGCNPESLPYRTKINAVYAYGQLNCSYKDGKQSLKHTIEAITGEKIQYTVTVRLDGVKDAIDALGGVEVNVPKDHTDVYPFTELSAERQASCVRSRTLPAYCVYTFKQGPQVMDGETALIYSRMRYLSSDFDRARRQQEVVSAIKDDILNDDRSTAEKAKNLFEMYRSLSGKIEADLSLEMVLAGLDLAGKTDKDPIRVILDPSFGGGGYIVNGEGSNFNFSDYTFASIQSQLAFINENYQLYKESPNIYAVNQTGVNWTNDNPILKYRERKYWFVQVTTETRAVEPGKEGITLVDFSDGEFEETISLIRKEYEGTPIEVVKISSEDTAPSYTKSRFGEDIALYIHGYNPSNNLNQ